MIQEKDVNMQAKDLIQEYSVTKADFLNRNEFDILLKLILSIYQSYVKEKEKSDIIRSIVKLDATDGATDDASCLREIYDRITSKQDSELKKGKQKKIIFEITDGASSCPGSAKEAVQELLSKNVEIYAFQMGKSNNTNEKIFNFIWNEGYKEPHGIMIGEQIERLPKELLKAVGKNMQSVFDNY